MQKKYPLSLLFCLLTCALLLLLTSCTGLSTFLGSPDPLTLADAPADSTATLTPFLPIASTATLEATMTPLVTDTPTPTPTIYTPTPLPWHYGLKTPEGQVRIALLGSDYRPSGGFRTDVIMIVSINPESKTATVVSFPRDLYVRIPGQGEERINTAFTYGGFDLFNATLQENFGFQVDYYVMTNFAGFINIINNLGGIDVNSGAAFSDKCDLPIASDGICYVGAGPVHMDGATALWYARARYTTSDFDRTRRAQEIISAIFNRLLRFDVLSKLPSLYSIYAANVETNLDLAAVEKIAPIAPTIAQTGHTRNYAVSTTDTIPYTTPGGGAVLQPIYENIYAILKEALFTP